MKKMLPIIGSLLRNCIIGLQFWVHHSLSVRTHSMNFNTFSNFFDDDCIKTILFFSERKIVQLFERKIIIVAIGVKKHIYVHNDPIFCHKLYFWHKSGILKFKKIWKKKWKSFSIIEVWKLYTFFENKSRNFAWRCLNANFSVNFSQFEVGKNNLSQGDQGVKKFP